MSGADAGPERDRPAVSGGTAGARVLPPAAATEVFVQAGPRLRAVAYGVLGSLDEAEDVVQEAWLRLARADVRQVRDVAAWLVVVTGRIALDVLRSARARRESYPGPWLPEPVVTWPGSDADPAGEDPADVVVREESLSLALLVVLETLSPAERTAFVLHDVFGVDFAGVGDAVGRSPEACRQLASRARRHVADRRPRYESTPGAHRAAVGAFLAACSGRDLRALVELLDTEVVLRSDGGGAVSAARRPVVGADRVARFLVGLVQRAAAGDGPRGLRADLAEVNGRTGLVVAADTGVVGVVDLDVVDGRVAAVAVVVNPDKLRGVGPSGRP